MAGVQPEFGQIIFQGSVDVYCYKNNWVSAKGGTDTKLCGVWLTFWTSQVFGTMHKEVLQKTSFLEDTDQFSRSYVNLK